MLGSPNLCRSVLLRDAIGKGTPARLGGILCLLRRDFMNKLVMSARNFLRQEDGVTAIEYGLLAALIAVAITVGAALVGTNLNALFNAIGGCLASNAAAANCAI